MISKDKKVKMFMDVDGKCEYCKCDMFLSFKNKVKPVDNLATFDHKYNRDHELRTHHNGDKEKRIFIVCWKCNNDKARKEKNNQEINNSEKTAKKLVPKEKWGEEKLMQRLMVVIEDEKQLNYKLSKVENQIKYLLHEKTKLTIQISKKVKYRNLILSFPELNEKINA